jgi:pimeloyl-ACP methyl ester carboxylesterase
MVPWTAARRWATAIEGALVLPLDGVGHWIPRDAPARVVAALGDVAAD